MNDVISALKSWASSVEEVVLDDAIKEKLGAHAAEAEAYSGKVRAFTFRYKVAGELVAGFIVLPRDIEGGPLPVIIYNRGGTGDFSMVKKGMYFRELADFATSGYVVVGSQYPGNSLSEGKDEHGGADLDSVLALHDLITKLPCADSERIGMLGKSRGGMMAYLAASRVPWIKAVVALAAPSDLIRGQAIRPEMKQVYEESFGGSEPELRKRSAIHWPERISHVPILLLHGTEDVRVSVQDSIDLEAKLREVGGEVKIVTYEGGDHLLSQYYSEWTQEAKDWFGRYL